LIGAFIVGLFAALPLWFLSTQERWVHFSGGGTPWRLMVTRWPALGTRSESFAPSWISAESVRGRRGVILWQIWIQEGNRDHGVLASRTTNGRAYPLAKDLEAARKAGTPIERELGPDATFYVAIGMLVIFAGAGVVIACGGSRSAPAGHA
jgi:hypothetical protein